MDPVFAWIEQIPVSVWLREADTFFAFPAVLTVHVISLGLAVGSWRIEDVPGARNSERLLHVISPEN